MNKIEELKLCESLPSFSKFLFNVVTKGLPDEQKSEKQLDTILDSIESVMSSNTFKTNIDSKILMGKYARDIGQLLFEMDNLDYPINLINFSFNENAEECLKTFVMSYIKIHLEEIVTKDPGEQLIDQGVWGSEISDIINFFGEENLSVEKIYNSAAGLGMEYLEENIPGGLENFDFNIKKAINLTYLGEVLADSYDNMLQLSTGRIVVMK